MLLTLLIIDNIQSVEHVLASSTPIRKARAAISQLDFPPTLSSASELGMKSTSRRMKSHPTQNVFLRQSMGCLNQRRAKAARMFVRQRRPETPLTTNFLYFIPASTIIARVIPTAPQSFPSY